MRLTLVAIGYLAVLTAAASAQGTQPAGQLADEHVQRVLMLALDNIHRGMCENTRPCAPTTPAEKQNPPITLQEARAIMYRGIMSGAALHCGLDWQRRNFEPMMAHWRHTMKKTPRQMAAVGLLHGIMQGMTGPESEAQKKCTDQMRQNLEQVLTFKS